MYKKKKVTPEGLGSHLCRQKVHREVPGTSAGSAAVRAGASGGRRRCRGDPGARLPSLGGVCHYGGAQTVSWEAHAIGF